MVIPEYALFAAAVADHRFWIALAIAVLAGMVRGFSGFGSAQIYIPLIAAVYSPRVAAVTLLIIDALGTAPFTVRAFAYCTWREVLPMSIAAAIAVPYSSPASAMLSIRPQCRDQQSKKRRAIIIGGSMSGLFSAAFLRQIGWDVRRLRAFAASSSSAAAPASPRHPELLEALEASGAGTRDLGIEVPKRFAIDRAGPRHRRAAAAPNPDLVGSAATAAARHRRSRAVPSRLGFRARRTGRPRRPRSFQRRPHRTRRYPGRRRRHPLHGARPGRARSCSRSMPAITSGAARRTRSI